MAIMTELIGKRIGGWTIGKLVGSGACGTVHYISSEKKNNGDDEYVMKLIPLSEKSVNTLLVKYLFYQNIGFHPNIPTLKIRPSNHLKMYGKRNGYMFLIIKRLGVDLMKWRTSKKSPFQPSWEWISHIGVQMLDVLKYIHSHQYVYVDIRPDNFLFDHDDDNDENKDKNSKVTLKKT